MKQIEQRYAVIVIPVVSNSRNLSRLTSLLKSIARNEPCQTKCLLVVDGPTSDSVSKAVLDVGIHIAIIENPRHGVGQGWSGGLIVGLLTAYQWLIRSDWNFDIVLKMDDDAFVAKPFLTELRRLVLQNRKVGIFGYYQFGTYESPYPTEWNTFQRAFYRRTKIATYDREVGGLWISLFGWRRKLRRLLNLAELSGYRYGEWVQGGVYALTRDCVEAIASNPLIGTPSTYIHCDITEDFFFTIATKASGFEIWYENHKICLFASSGKGLPMPIELLKNRNYSLIHSVKSNDLKSELLLISELTR